jgi:hypothetical protein
LFGTDWPSGGNAFSRSIRNASAAITKCVGNSFESIQPLLSFSVNPTIHPNRSIGRESVMRFSTFAGLGFFMAGAVVATKDFKSPDGRSQWTFGETASATLH